MSVKWGEYKLKDLFNHIEQGRRLKKSDQAKGEIPFVMSGTTRQGIVGYISNPVASFPANSITVDIFGNTFYRCYSFGAGDDTGVYWNDKIQYSEGAMLFIAAAIGKLLKGNYSYGHKLRSSQSFDFVILLPQTIEGNIDYAFMDDFVRQVEELRLCELEKSHSNKLEAYLSEAGFEDCKLTDSEKEAINRVKNGKVNFVPVKIGDKLTGEKGDVDIQNKDINGRGLYFVNSGVQNFGIKGMTDRKAKVFPKNTITIDFFGNAYYRPFNYVMATHNHVFSMSGEIIRNENIGLYLCASMSYLNKIYSFSNMGTWPIFKDSFIFLPTHPTDGQIDYDFMDTYINAIKKQCIETLKQEISREHNAYEQAVGLKSVEIETKKDETKVIILPEYREGCIPLYTLHAACGIFDSESLPEGEGWVDASGYGFKPNPKRHFAIHAKGNSMFPDIKDGDICVFEWYNQTGGTREGDIVLAECDGIDDECTIKKYHSVKKYYDDGSWEHEKIELIPLNNEYDKIVLDADSKYRTIGIFKCVL